ncbi:sigma-70 family RNA polymerase sigma factor [Kitasatospora sp. NPDC097643]|uniref:sigma-70 family RNA polymerase sigma factor n=1 Tax=Kitasatospora sp. NPDC097643 TaxID=3157230 RepID=UPI00331A07FF
MRIHGGSSTETVLAAQARDAVAREQLIADHLPLVYNIVGRAMDGHADVDDVVQETMLRAVHSLHTLRDPSSFRSWLVAIAMNEVRRCWTTRRSAPEPGLHELTEITDPAADFVDLTILRLGLTGHRRQVAEATRWLDERERDLLSLWWLETGGELTRAELAAALGLTPQHTAVRVQRMKEQLEVGRLVVQALAAEPPCAELSALTATWDGQPSGLWRKRIARHARDCPHCAGRRRNLIPVEALLAGLPLLLPPPHLSVSPHSVAFATAAAQQPLPDTSTAPTRPLRPPGRQAMRTATAAGALALVLAVLGAVQLLQPGPDHTTPAPLVTATPPSPAPTPTPTTPSATPTATEPPSAPTATEPPSAPTATPAPRQAAPTPAPSSPAPEKTLEQQLVDLINIQRTKNGCRPLRVNARLHAAAQGHSDDMAARNYFDHNTPEGVGPATRMTNAGYRWSAGGENLDQAPGSPSTVVEHWSNESMHQQTMLNCQFTDAGVGTAASANGLLWTLDLGTPR